MHGVVRKFASELVKPRVAAMDEKEAMDPVIIRSLFEHGVSQATS
jgi:hypothetical protein